MESDAAGPMILDSPLPLQSLGLTGFAFAIELAPCLFGIDAIFLQGGENKKWHKRHLSL